MNPIDTEQTVDDQRQQLHQTNHYTNSTFMLCPALESTGAGSKRLMYKNTFVAVGHVTKTTNEHMKSTLYTYRTKVTRRPSLSISHRSSSVRRNSHRHSTVPPPLNLAAVLHSPGLRCSCWAAQAAST